MGGIDQFDLAHLNRCLDLAKRGVNSAYPNPLVGGVLVESGEVIGEGFHLRPGLDHGEKAAIENSRERRLAHRLAGSTLYVNLEPCAHHGRTAPCSQAVIEAGVGRVVCAHRDPNPEARGGAEELRQAGVEVAFLEQSDPQQCEVLRQAIALNSRFLAPIVRNRPLVTLKWAMSLDGKIATKIGMSQWISGPEAREWAVSLRQQHDAILVGSGTALTDDPRLTRRPSTGHAAEDLGQIVRVVADRRLRTQPTARLFTEPGPVLIFTQREALEKDTAVERIRLLEESGAELVMLDRVTPSSIAADLWERGLKSVLVEGGGAMLGAFRDEGVVDCMAVCCAPIVIGGIDAQSPVAGAGADLLDDGFRLGWSRGRQVGTDWVIEGIEAGCLQDLLSSVVE